MAELGATRTARMVLRNGVRHCRRATRFATENASRSRFSESLVRFGRAPRTGAPNAPRLGHAYPRRAYMPPTRRGAAREVRPGFYASVGRTREKRFLGTRRVLFKSLFNAVFPPAESARREERFRPVFRACPTDGRFSTFRFPFPYVHVPPIPRHERSKPPRGSSPTPWLRPTRMRTRKISPSTKTTTTAAASRRTSTRTVASVCGAAARRSSRRCSRGLLGCEARFARGCV